MGIGIIIRLRLKRADGNPNGVRTFQCRRKFEKYINHHININLKKGAYSWGFISDFGES